MSTISKLLSGTAILIGVYLFVTNYTGTTQIITALGSSYTGAVKSLQGR